MNHNKSLDLKGGDVHLVSSLACLLSWRPSIMEKELAGSSSSFSSSKRQWAAVNANLFPICGGSKDLKVFLFSTSYKLQEGFPYQYSPTSTIDVVSFCVFIPQKRSKPGVSICLKRGFQLTNAGECLTTASLPPKILPCLLLIPQRH